MMGVREERVKREVFHPEMANVHVTLKNAPLWKQFNKEGTEMIITKSGRRMFPSVRLGITGLDPESRYFVLLETLLADCHRYKFTAAEWSVVGGAEPQTHSSTRLYVHPDSPATGSTWMSQDVLFHRAKLTNNTLDRTGNMVLTSMHKYQPRIHIIKASDILALHWSPTLTVTFPETEFIAVTAYQNEKITKLKIDNNPFAKGFRENGQARTKRKSAALEGNGSSHNGSGDEESAVDRPSSPSSSPPRQFTASPINSDRPKKLLAPRPTTPIKREEDEIVRDRITRTSPPSSVTTTSPITVKPYAGSSTVTQDDSGVSVGSGSPAPASPASTPPPQPSLSFSSFHQAMQHRLNTGAPPLPLLPPLPPAPFYPHTLWPYNPFSYYHPIPYYPPTFHHPILDLSFPQPDYNPKSEFID